MIYILRDADGSVLMLGDLDELRSIAPDQEPEVSRMTWAEYDASV